MLMRTSFIFRPISWALTALVFCAPGHGEITGISTHLTANFERVSLEQALSEIADYTGVEISTSQPLNEPVLVSYQDITTEKLLNRLLYGYNAMYLRDDAGRLQSVRIFAKGNAPAVQNNPQPANTSTESTAQNGRYYLTVLVNGTAVKMLVDTGANTLAISQSLATQLSLAKGQAAEVKTAAGTGTGYRTTIDELVIAGKSLKGVQALILPNLAEKGLIGQNVLSHFHQVTKDGKMTFKALGEDNGTDNKPTADNNQKKAGQSEQTPQNGDASQKAPPPPNTDASTAPKTNSGG